MISNINRILLVVVSALSVCHCVLADDSERVSYYSDIRPIFQAHCTGCHQPAKAEGAYVMTSVEHLQKMGESAEPSLVPGQPAQSYLVSQITPDADGAAEMPKGKPALAKADIELIRKWIAQGAKDDTPANATEVIDAEHPPVYSKPPVVTSLDYSPDGKLLAISGFHEVLLRSADGQSLAA